MDDNCPPVLALRFALTSGDLYSGRRGRPRINLLGTIQDDLKEHKLSLKTVDDLNTVRQLANDKSECKGMFMYRSQYNV